MIKLSDAEQVTTIQITKKTQNSLKSLWQNADDTYDTIIQRLLKKA